MADLIEVSDLTDAIPSMASRSDLEFLVSAASRAVEKHCDRLFGYAPGLVEHLSGRNRPSLWLSRPPIVEISSISVNGVDLDNSNDDAWSFDPDTGELIRGEGNYDPRFAQWWPNGFRNIVVTYGGGFNPIPDDVKAATIALAKWMTDTYKVTGAVQSEKLGDYQYMAASGAGASFPPSVAAMLAPYRRTWVA